VTRILLVDDNRDLLLSLRHALEHEGYEVRCAGNGGEALKIQHERCADIVITDLFMPEVDGFETIAGLRAAFPKTRIVVMSGDAQRARGEYLSAAKLLGVDATLRKPVQVDTLLETLRTLDSRRAP
jgi:CheY-like chemotaxis protein